MMSGWNNSLDFTQLLSEGVVFSTQVPNRGDVMMRDMGNRWGKLVWAHVTQVEGHFQVVLKVVGEFRVHLQHFDQIFAQYFVKVAVGQRPYVTTRLSNCLIATYVFTKYIALPWAQR